LKILEGKAEYKEKSQIKTWLFSVIRFTAYEEGRKEVQNISLESLSDLAYEEDAPEIDFHEAMIQSLPDRQREVLLLVFYHNLTLEKAAEIMEISIGTVRKHYDRGKRNLKALILKKTLHENNR